MRVSFADSSLSSESSDDEYNSLFTSRTTSIQSFDHIQEEPQDLRFFLSAGNESTNITSITLPNISTPSATSTRQDVFSEVEISLNVDDVSDYIMDFCRERGLSIDKNTINYLLEELHASALDLLSGGLQHSYHRIGALSSQDRAITYSPHFSECLLRQEFFMGNAQRCKHAKNVYQEFGLSLELPGDDDMRLIIPDKGAKSSWEERGAWLTMLQSIERRFRACDECVLPLEGRLLSAVRSSKQEARRRYRDEGKGEEESEQSMSVLNQVERTKQALKRRTITSKDILCFLEVDGRYNPKSRFRFVLRNKAFVV